MPPAITGPGPSNDPPRASTPSTVLNSWTASKSQMIFPSLTEYARRCPSLDPENTTPGITVTAADCAGLHGRRSPHPGDGVFQSTSPVVKPTANKPPPACGSSTKPAGVI